MLGWTFSVIESEKGQKELLWRSRNRGVPGQSQNCRIHFTVRQSIFPNAVFGALRSTRRQTRLPMDKGFNPKGVSQYIRDGTWGLKSVLVTIDSTWRNHPTTPRQLPGLKTPEHVSILDL